MPRRSLVLFLTLTLAVLSTSITGQEPQPQPNPQVVIETSEGDITVELFRSEARVTVVNFLTYVRDGFYDGTIFHRVIRNFMIQGGGFDADLNPASGELRGGILNCLLYTSPSPRDRQKSRMPSSA